MKILLVEDNQSDARLLREALDDGGLQDCELVHVVRLGDALERLAQEPFDALFLDLSLPDAQGVGIVAAIQQRTPAMPVVVLTGTDDAQLGVAAIQAGAQDYLVKGK